MDERLVRLAGCLPLIEDPGFLFGEWRGGDRQEDGAVTMPYFEFSRPALELIAAMPVTMGFDWRTWVDTDEAKRLSDPGAVATATAEQLFKLTTAIVRGDRFIEGNLAATFESGLLEAIVRRARALTSR